MEKVRVGIVGVGNMGSGHVENYAAGKIKNGKLTAVCDLKPERLAWAKEKAGEDLLTFTDVDEMLGSGAIDALVIAVPHYLHPVFAMRAFAKGIHVLSEKPAGVYTSAVREMNEAAEKSGLVFGIMFNQRKRAVTQTLKREIDKGTFGGIRRATWIITSWYRSQSYYDSGDWRATWSGEGGGVLMNQCPHNLDLWQWFFGMPKSIWCTLDFGKYHDIEVEDDVTAMAKYPNGATGVFITTTGEFPGTNRLEITGSKGKLVYERGHLMYTKLGTDEREFTFASNQGFASIPCETEEIAVPEGHGEQHNGILKNFTNHILFGEELLAPGYEGINGLSIANAMVLSSETGKWVDLPNDGEEFWAMLQEKIKTSKNKEDAGVVFDT